MLVSTSKKVSSKNLTLPKLSWSENLAKAISKVSRGKLSIFWSLTLVGLYFSFSLAAKAGVITLAVLLELIKALTLVWYP